MSNNKRVTMDFNDHANLVASCASLREQCTELTAMLHGECVYMCTLQNAGGGRYSRNPVFKVINQERLDSLPELQKVLINELAMASNRLQDKLHEVGAVSTFNKRVAFWSSANSTILCANCIAMAVYSLISIFGA